jgi:hypothetical protein
MASWLTTWPPFTLAPSLSILALLVSLLTLLISKTLFFQGISFYFALKNVTFFLVLGTDLILIDRLRIVLVSVLACGIFA